MVPSSINVFLREYQRDGIQFFWERWRDGRGGILGDDMGLVSFHLIPSPSFYSWASLRVSLLAKDFSSAFEPVSGKTIQVIAFLSAVMKKYGDERDLNRRHRHVSRLQDGDDWRLHRRLPPANATWPTCLIIAPSTVVHNWERELDVVRGKPKSMSSILD